MLKKAIFSQRVPRFRFASSRSWLSPHARVLGSVRIVQRVPRFRSASSRSWLSPHARGSAPSALTSIPLRSISVVAFATWKRRKRAKGNASTSPWLSFFFSALLNASRKKPPSPQLLCLQKQRFSSAPSGARTLDTLIKSLQKQRFSSAPSGARTLDTLIKSQVLYQLS